MCIKLCRVWWGCDIFQNIPEPANVIHQTVCLFTITLLSKYAVGEHYLLPNLTPPVIVRRTLPALRSRWITLLWCRNSRPMHICWHTKAIWGSVNGFSSSTIIESRAPPSQYSISIWKHKHNTLRCAADTQKTYTHYWHRNIRLTALPLVL